jgi:hypothetical protein
MFARKKQQQKEFKEWAVLILLGFYYGKGNFGRIEKAT